MFPAGSQSLVFLQNFFSSFPASHAVKHPFVLHSTSGSNGKEAFSRTAFFHRSSLFYTQEEITILPVCKQLAEFVRHVRIFQKKTMELDNAIAATEAKGFCTGKLQRKYIPATER